MASALDELIAGKGAPTAQVSNTSNLDALISGKPIAAPTATPAAKSPNIGGSVPGIPDSALTGDLGGGYGTSNVLDMPGVKSANGSSLGKPEMTFLNTKTMSSDLLKNRIAPNFDPTKPQKINPSVLENGRMPKAASDAVRKATGAAPDEQLDHLISLELGGSNDTSNLNPEKLKSDNTQPSLTLENNTARRVANGEISYIDGQKIIARAKGVRLPDDTDFASADHPLAGGYPNAAPNQTVPPKPTSLLSKAGSALKSFFNRGKTTPQQDAKAFLERNTSGLASTAPVKVIAKMQGGEGILSAISDVYGDPLGARMSGNDIAAIVAKQQDLVKGGMNKQEATKQAVAAIKMQKSMAVMGRMGAGDTMPFETSLNIEPGGISMKITTPELENAWRTLGSPTTEEEAMKNYRALAHQFHPDVVGGSNEAMVKINKAFALIKENGLPGDMVYGTKAEVAPEEAMPSTPTAAPEEAPVSKTPALDDLAKPENEKGLTAPSEKYMKAFNASENQKVLGKIGQTEFALGDIGANHFDAKAAEGKGDRLSLQQLKDTLPHLKEAYNGSTDVTNHRSNTAAWVAKMPDGEQRVVYTKQNRLGQEEITSAHSVSSPDFVKTLKENGIPPGNRTQILPLEPARPNPLDERDNTTLAQGQKAVKPTYYHGTSPENAAKIRENGFTVSEKPSNGALLGKGVYLDKTGGKGAKLYGGEVMEINVKPNLKLFKGNPLDLAIPETNYGDPGKVTAYLKAQGYDGVEGKNQINIFDPKNVFVKPKAAFPKDLRNLGNNATVEKIEKMKEGDPGYKSGARYRLTVALEDSLGERGKMAELFYDSVPSRKEIIEGIKEEREQRGIEEQPKTQKTNTVGKENLKALEAKLRKAYAAHPNAQKELEAIWEQLDIAQAGRVTLAGPKGGMVGEERKFMSEPSTFPSWIPEDLRSRKLFDKVMGGLKDVSSIEFPPAKNTAQRALYNEILDYLDEQLGIDTSATRNAIMKSNDRSAEKTENEGISGRSAEGGEIKPEEVFPEKASVAAPKAKPRESVVMASGLNPNLDKFMEQDLKPQVGELLTGTKKTWDFIKKTFAPATRGPEAEKTAAIMRESLAKMARKREKLYGQLKAARKMFDKYSDQEALDVIDKIETGQPVQGSEKFVAIIRDALDSRWAKIRQIKGTDAYIENYFPHIWEDPDEAKNKLTQIMAKRPLEGTKSYMKERKIPTIKEGVALGLKPVSYNPVDLVMARVVDMDKYIMAQDVWNQFKQTGLNKFVRPGGDVPTGWRKVDDRISTSFYRPTIKEYYDEHIMNSLNDVAKSLGITHERAMGGKGLSGSRLGVSYTGQDLIKTKFATPEDVLIHEIGHQIDHKFNMQSVMNPTGTGKTLPFSEWEKTGTAFKDEMRALADLRWEGKASSNYFKQYVRQGSEKMAVMFQSYLHAPERFQEVAPTVYDAFVKFLNSDPKLKPLADIKKSLVYGENQVELHILAKAGDWYMPEQATTIVNNYLSPGLRGNPIYNAFRMMGNTLNQIQLGLSGFHAIFTSGDAVISKAALEFQKAFDTSATLSQRAISFSKVLTAPITAPYYLYKNIIRGNALLNDYYKNNPEIPDMVTALERAGGRVKMDSFYLNDSVQNFLKALRTGNYLGATGRAPGAIIETLSKPLMQELVPRQKLGVFADGAKFIMDRAQKEEWSEYKTTLRLQELWDSVDNRMGELVYDNLFWQKSLKDLGMAATRSLGWNLGTFRELGGGAADYGKLMFKAFTKEGRANARVTPKMAYTAVLPYIVGLWGGMLFYAYNHKAPETMLDYFYPRTGRLKPDGTPERISLPSYMKDVFAYKTEPMTTITNKLHPELATIIDMFQNQDYYGTEIRNPHDPIVSQIGELFAYQAQQFVPFSISNLQQRQTTGSSWLDYLESFGGITPAPGYITRTPLQTQIYTLYDERFGGGTQTQDQSAAAQLKSKIRTQYLLGNDEQANKLLQQAVDQGIIKQTGVAQFVKEADIPNDVKLFQRLPATDQAALLKDMQLYQLERYAWYALKDVKATLGDLSDNAKNFVDLQKAGDVKEPQWKRGQIVGAP